MALPTAAFDTAKSILAGRSILKVTVGTTEHVFESKMLKHNIDQKKDYHRRPDANGVNRIVRSWVTEQNEKFLFESDEAKRIVEIFDGALAGNTRATATLWIPDPADASGKVALKSEDAFTCDIVREGDLEFGGPKLTTNQYALEVIEDHLIQFTKDATVT